MKILVNFFLSVSILIISSCGGDPSPTPTDPSTVFSLFSSNSFNVGDSENYSIVGTDTLGGTYTGTFSSQTQAQTTFIGIPAIPVLAQLQLTNTANNVSASKIGTMYWSTSASDRRKIGCS